jgi:Cof subfamily protein (haloacid dehalogenase superfamily)
MIKLLAVDIDGTLLDTKGLVPDAHRQALADAAAHGVAVVLVTGRSTHFTRAVAAALPLPVTLILNNGALVITPDGRTAVRHLLDRATAREVLVGTRAYEDSVAVVFDRHPNLGEGRQVVFERMDWTHPNRRGYYEKNKAFIIEASPLEAALTEDPLEVMFTGCVAPMRGAADTLRRLPNADRFSISVTEYEHRDFSLVDVNGAGCSKGATLGRWTAELGMTSDEIMAVGDNLNDLEMLRFAGTAVVMGNAAEGLKRHGFHVTGTNDEGGLASAIRRFALVPRRSGA